MMTGTGLTAIDIAGIVWFFGVWFAFIWLVDFSQTGQQSLAKLMERQRSEWMYRCAARDNRIFDSQIMNGLGQGAAFFASTSLIAVGGALTLFQNTETAAALVAELPATRASTAIVWEIKSLGLVAVFAYCFFKFGWSLRLFNYAAILMGAIPPLGHPDRKEIDVATARAARMLTIAGQHFNAGQRGLFLSIGYLCWFFSPWAFIAGSTFVFLVLYRRQFHSRARQACLIDEMS